jgi:hypothetical protein
MNRETGISNSHQLRFFEGRCHITLHTTRFVIGMLLVPGVSGGASDEAKEEEEGPNIGEVFGSIADLRLPVE